mgnify:CR=1 FL=1
MPSRRTLLGVLAGLPFLGGLAAYAAERRPFYTGPLSDHFDGTRFFDPHGSPPKAFTELLRWQFGGDRRASWPDSWPGPDADRPPPRVDDDSLRLSYVGHASVLLQTRGLNILFDPVWSERVSPVSFALLLNLVGVANASSRISSALRSTAPPLAGPWSRPSRAHPAIMSGFRAQLRRSRKARSGVRC